MIVNNILKKPIVGTKLDTSNAFTRSIACCLDFNENTGSPYDATLNKNNGTINGGVTWAQNGKWGSCLSFNGSNSYLTFPAATVGLTGATSATISIWIQTSAATTAQAAVANTGSTAANGEFYLDWTAGSTLSLRAYYSSSSAATATTSTTYSAGQWIHAVGVITTATIYLYVNGTLAVSVASGNAWTCAAGNLSVGVRVPTAPSLYWNGYLDGVRFWSRALSAGEIASLYANYWQIYQPPLTVGLLGWQNNRSVFPSIPKSILAA